MNDRAAIVISCWLAIAIISSVYMYVFGPDVEILFGVFVPIGFLVLAALIVTFMALSETNTKKEHEQISKNS
jgi:hypothetical protein